MIAATERGQGRTDSTHGLRVPPNRATEQGHGEAAARTGRGPPQIAAGAGAGAGAGAAPISAGPKSLTVFLVHDARGVRSVTTLHAVANWRVCELKKAVEESTGVPPKVQALWHGRHMLAEDSRTLADYMVAEASQLRMSLLLGAATADKSTTVTPFDHIGLVKAALHGSEDVKPYMALLGELGDTSGTGPPRSPTEALSKLSVERLVEGITTTLVELNSTLDRSVQASLVATRLRSVLRVLAQRIAPCSSLALVRKVVVMLLHTALVRAPLVVELSADETVLPLWIQHAATCLGEILSSCGLAREMFVANEFAVDLCCDALYTAGSPAKDAKRAAALMLLARFSSASTSMDDICTVGSAACRKAIRRVARAGFMQWAKAHIKHLAADINIVTARLHAHVVCHSGAAIPRVDAMVVEAVHNEQSDFMDVVSHVASVCLAVVATNSTPDDTNVGVRGASRAAELVDLEMDSAGFAAVPVGAVHADYTEDDRAISEFVLRLLSSTTYDMLIRGTVIAFKSLAHRNKACARSAARAATAVVHLLNGSVVGWEVLCQHLRAMPGLTRALVNLAELGREHGGLAAAARSLLGRLEPRLLAADRLGQRALQILPTFTYRLPRPTAARTRSEGAHVAESKGEVAGGADEDSGASQGADGSPASAGVAAGAPAGDADAAPAQCSVCLLAFEEGDTLRILPCLHMFHQECVDQWLCVGGGVGSDQGRPCPLCKHPVCAAELQKTQFRQAGEEAAHAWSARGGPAFVDLYGD